MIFRGYFPFTPTISSSQKIAPLPNPLPTFPEPGLRRSEFTLPPDEARGASRMLIVSASFGEGHNAAARAVQASAVRELGAANVRMVDAFALAAPRLNRVACRAYIEMINRAPKLWRVVYERLDRKPLNAHTMRLFRREIRALAAVIREFAPNAICSTYPLYGYMIAVLARAGEEIPPLYNVVTDSISVHSLWWRAPCAGWFSPNHATTEVLVRAGTPENLVHTSGFPVPEFFRENRARHLPPDLGTGATPRILYIINSGRTRVLETAAALLAEGNWVITFAVGRNPRLQASVAALASGLGRNAQVLGWTNRIPELLMTHHVVVSKAGGATVQEAIAAGCPLVANQVVPGQEEGNLALLQRHGVGGFAATPRELIELLRTAFADQGALWNKWRERLRAVAPADAAPTIVRHILSAISPAENNPGSSARE